MNTVTQQEKISILMDGELADAELDDMLAAWAAEDSADDWDVYHQIGDVLRSDDLAMQLSTDFSERFRQKLAVEPVVFAPRNVVSAAFAISPAKKFSFGKSYIAMAGVAAAIFVFIFAPQLNQTETSLSPNMQLGRVTKPESAIQLASTPRPNEVAQLSSATIDKTQISSNSGQVEMDMLRDPRIDSYLAAHQRFSPAMSGGAQYVTRANAMTNLEK